MNNNKIANPKVKVPTGMVLNDKDYLGDLLSCLKAMEKNYVIAMEEASNENLYHEFQEIFLSLATLQRDVYELMFQNGWYNLEKAESMKIDQKAQSLSVELSDLEKPETEME